MVGFYDTYCTRLQFRETKHFACAPPLCSNLFGKQKVFFMRLKGKRIFSIFCLVQEFKKWQNILLNYLKIILLGALTRTFINFWIFLQLRNFFPSLFFINKSMCWKWHLKGRNVLQKNFLQIWTLFAKSSSAKLVNRKNFFCQIFQNWSIANCVV